MNTYCIFLLFYHKLTWLGFVHNAFAASEKGGERSENQTGDRKKHLTKQPAGCFFFCKKTADSNSPMLSQPLQPPGKLTQKSTCELLFALQKND